MAGPILLRHSWDLPLGASGSEISHHVRTPSADWFGLCSSIESSRVIQESMGLKQDLLGPVTRVKQKEKHRILRTRWWMFRFAILVPEATQSEPWFYLSWGGGCPMLQLCRF